MSWLSRLLSNSKCALSKWGSFWGVFNCSVEMRSFLQSAQYPHPRGLEPLNLWTFLGNPTYVNIFATVFFFIDKYEYIELKWFELIWTVLPFCVFVFWFQVPCLGCSSAQGFLADRCPELRSSDWNDLMSDSLDFFASDLRSFQESAAGGLHGFGWNEWNKTAKMFVSRKIKDSTRKLFGQKKGRCEHILEHIQAQNVQKRHKNVTPNTPWTNVKKRQNVLTFYVFYVTFHIYAQWNTSRKCSNQMCWCVSVLLTEMFKERLLSVL